MGPNRPYASCMCTAAFSRSQPGLRKGVWEYGGMEREVGVDVDGERGMVVDTGSTTSQAGAANASSTFPAEG